MKINDAMRQVFSDCKIRQAEWHSTGHNSSITYKVEITIPNKWDAYLNLEDGKDSQFTNYNGPCGHMRIDNYNANNIDDLLVIRKNVEDYIKLMEMISDIQESSKDIKSSRQRLRDIKLEKILN